MKKTHEFQRVYLLAYGAIGIWLGVLALRTFMARVVWNVAEDAPTATMAAWAFGVYAVGLLAWLPARFLGGRRPALRFGLCLAAATVARQAFTGPVISAVLAFAAVDFWLWWLPAFLQEYADAGLAYLVAPAALLGLSAQTAVQTAAHGLDLPAFTGLSATGYAVLLAAVFALTLWQSGGTAAVPADRQSSGAAARGAVALFAFLFVGLTLTTNPGRVEVLSGGTLASASVIIQGCLLVGLLFTGWHGGRAYRAGAALIGIAGAAGLLRTFPQAAWLLLPLQAALAFLLQGAFQPAGRLAASAGGEAAATADGVLSRPQGPQGPQGGPGPNGRIYAGTAVGALLLMVLLLLFYAVYEWPLLWVAAAALVAVLGLVPGETATRLTYPQSVMLWPVKEFRYLPLVLLLLAVTGLGLGGLPYRPGAAAAEPADGPAPRQVRVLQYNIHQGFDTYSVPAMTRIARTIDATDADIVALQEVNRGWNLSGGVDMAAWLTWRYPGYHVVYGPMNGALWGNVIMSRYPVREQGTLHFPMPSSGFPRGLVWATVAGEGGDLRVASLHYSAYAGFDADRIAQSDALLAFWNQAPRTLLVGDTNAHQSDQAITALLAGGLKEATQGSALWDHLSYPAKGPVERLDYIFLSPDLTPVSAEFPQSDASDHLPLVGVVRMGLLPGSAAISGHE